MKKLQDIDVVLVSEEGGDLDLLPVWLRSEGAILRSTTWADLASTCAKPPEVLIADLDEATWPRLQQLGASWPVIGLVERGFTLPTDAGVSKWIVKPVHPADIVSAIVSLVQIARPSLLPKSREEGFASTLQAAAVRQDTRGLLALINATGPFRYTSILRFDGEQLDSVWTYDREAPASDSFPIDKSVDASYCALVRETEKTVAFEDSNTEPTVANHPARYSVLSYCGALLRRDDGSPFGTLCHFDVKPRSFSEATVTKLESAAKAIQQSVVEAFGR